MPDSDDETETVEDDRGQGIDWGDLPDELEGASYPMSKDELLAEYGDYPIGLHTDDETTLEAVLDPIDVEEFESADDVMQLLSGSVGSDAIARKGETGRGTSGLRPDEEQQPPTAADEEEESL